MDFEGITEHGRKVARKLHSRALGGSNHAEDSKVENSYMSLATNSASRSFVALPTCSRCFVDAVIINRLTSQTASVDRCRKRWVASKLLLDGRNLDDDDGRGARFVASFFSFAATGGDRCATRGQRAHTPTWITDEELRNSMNLKSTDFCNVMSMAVP